jgi:hypothetical protein
VGDASTAADISHIIDGYSHAGREDQKLEHIPLEAYRGVRPAWWPESDDTWANSPNNSLDTAFWASVCTSACVRDHHDTVNIVLVDLLAVNASCSCYAWEDTSGVDHNASHSAPSDAQIMDWMHESTRIVDALADVRIHAKLATYAVHQRVGKNYYSSDLQSTIYYSQILDPGYIYDVFEDPVISSSALYRPDTFEDCMYQCFRDLNGRTTSIHWWAAYTDQNGAAKESACYCIDESLGESKYGRGWRNRWLSFGTWRPFYYSVKLCTNVRASDERSVVYSKRNDGFCPGVPVVTGFTIASHSLLTVGQAGADENSVPFDVRCRKLCMEDEACGVAHLYASTFAYHDLANRCALPTSTSKHCCSFVCHIYTHSRVWSSGNLRRPGRHFRRRLLRRETLRLRHCRRHRPRRNTRATGCGGPVLWWSRQRTRSSTSTRSPAPSRPVTAP